MIMIFPGAFRGTLNNVGLRNYNYAYAFDNIGNRTAEYVAGTENAYAANFLSQYTEICSAEPNQQTAEPSNQPSSLQLSYDADGNATQVQTSTGTWSITYNGENRPVRFENAETQTVVECAYDSQGRRFEKKVTVATRPLAIQKDGTWFTYGYDLTKNICEVFGPAGYIRTAYAYAPFGSVSASGDITQPFQWSSEHYDSELDLVYYNYRHYSPSLGRFLSRDPIEEQGGLNLYALVENTWSEFDLRGLRKWKEEDSDCCEGKLYNDKTECCLQGRIVSRKLHGYTGVSYYVRRSRFYHIPIYNPLKIEQFFLMHAWFKIGEMRAGSYPGKIDLKEEEYSKLEDSILTFKTDIVLPVCKYDIESFKECVESRAREDAQNGILWEPWANNCRDWIRRVINDCKFASRRAEK